MPNNLLRVRTESNGWSGGPGLSTFYFNPGIVTPDAAMMTGVTGRVRSYFDAWKAFAPTTVSFQVNPVVDILDYVTGTLTGQVSAGSAPSVVNGTGGSNAGPAFVCAVARLTSGSFINGKKVRGRSYAGPLAAPFTDSVAPEGGLLAAIQNGLVLLNTSGGGPDLVIWHRPVNGAGGAAVGVVNTSASPIFGILRSRR